MSVIVRDLLYASLIYMLKQIMFLSLCIYVKIYVYLLVPKRNAQKRKFQTGITTEEKCLEKNYQGENVHKPYHWGAQIINILPAYILPIYTMPAYFPIIPILPIAISHSFPRE
jgi:hypothetical protein